MCFRKFADLMLNILLRLSSPPSPSQYGHSQLLPKGVTYLSVHLFKSGYFHVALKVETERSFSKLFVISVQAR